MAYKAETLSVRETAQRLGVTLKYVYDLIYGNRIPAKKQGREWRIPARAIEDRLKRGA